MRPMQEAVADAEVPKYRCLQLQNNDFHSYMLNICILNGAPPPKHFTGWTARPSSVEHLISTKALCCTAAAWNLIVAQCSANF